MSLKHVMNSATRIVTPLSPKADPGGGFVPGGPVTGRIVPAGRLRAGHQCPDRRTVERSAVGPRLHEDVAERGRLDWSGDDRAVTRIRGQLAQQRVARAAADDVYDVDVAPGQPYGIRAQRPRCASARLSMTHRT